MKCMKEIRIVLETIQWRRMGCVFMAIFTLEDGVALAASKSCASETDAMALCLKWQLIKNGQKEAPTFKKQTTIEYVLSTIKNN